MNITIGFPVAILLSFCVAFKSKAVEACKFSYLSGRGLNIKNGLAKKNAFQSQGGEVLNIQSLGAKGDGITDNTLIIQGAIDSMSKIGGGTVFIPEGVFLLKTTHPRGGNRSLLTPRSNVTIKGSGLGSILKVADNLYRYNVIYPPSNTNHFAAENIKFKDFVIECNGPNNVSIERGLRNKGAAIGLRYGRNIVIDGVIVRNNSGEQCFQFGSNVMPFTVTNLTITNCTFQNVGSVVKGNSKLVDHSVIYAQANFCRITNNRIINPIYGRVNTAIEIHTSNAKIEGNVVENFAIGVNIIATVTDMRNVEILNNRLLNTGRAFYFQNKLGRTLRDVNIMWNYVTQYDTSLPIVDASTKVRVPISNINISNNEFYFLNNEKKQQSIGISMKRTLRAFIQGNLFQNIRGPILQLHAPLGGAASIEVSNNRVYFDQSNAGALDIALVISNIQANNIASLKIVDNSIHSKFGVSIFKGVVSPSVQINRNVLKKTSKP